MKVTEQTHDNRSSFGPRKERVADDRVSDDKSWCEQCRILANSLEQLAKNFAGELKVAAVSLDLCPAVAARYGITTLPTLELFDSGTLDPEMPGRR